MPRTFPSRVAGVSHQNTDGTQRQDLVRSLRVGQQLQLVRDPKNPHDRNAVKVCRPDGKQLGFITARAAEDVRPYLDAGVDVEAVVAEIAGGTVDKPTVGVNLLITVYDDEELAQGAFAASSAKTDSIYSAAPGEGPKSALPWWVWLVVPVVLLALLALLG